jgi:NAD(P)H-dependent FMN reductase
MPHLQIVVASTRRGRKGPAVAAWFHALALRHGRFDVELVNLAEVGLPLLDEPGHPKLGRYVHEHTRAWSATVARADAFVFVTPEYNTGAPPSLLNAIDHLHREWAYKPAGFVSYGGISGGTRGVQMAKQVLTTLRVVPLIEAVALPFFAEQLDPQTGAFAATERQERAAGEMLDELRRWAEALRPLRTR